MKELSIGDLIADRFRVEALLGEGGIARVYKVRHVRLGSVHAVKILTLQRPALADRLLLEGRIQAQLRHPNLVRVTDVVEHDGNPCLVMEYVAGSHLQALLAEGGPLPLHRALDLFAGVLSAVATAHDLGVLHRDLKPANILLEQGRAGPVPKVSDFGIAKVAAEGLREGQTRLGVQMGTPGYMAPEQVEDSAAVDHRADIFALGAILYEMLCGLRPFQEDTAFHTMQATLTGRYPPLAERVPGCPPLVIEAIGRALAVRMQDRFASCHDFADALYPDRPELRARIERLEEVALPEGLIRPEITDAGIRSTPTTGKPTLVATDEGPDAPRSLPTMHTPEPDTDWVEAPAPLEVGAIAAGAADARGSSPSAVMAGLSSAMSTSPAPTGVAFSIENDSLAAPPPAEAARARTLPLGLLLLAAAAGLLVLGGAWWAAGDPDEELAVEALAPTDAVGEAVAPQAEGATEAPAAVEPSPGAATPAEPPQPGPATPAAVQQGSTQQVPVPEERVPVATGAAQEDPPPVVEEGPAIEEEPTAEEPDINPTIAPSGAGSAAEEEDITTAEERPPAPPPALTGTWRGTADGNPLTLQILSQDGEHFRGELRFIQGPIERVAPISGRVDPQSLRLQLTEEGEAGLSFQGVVRGTGMMGTYGRSGKGSSLSWSATRQ